MAEASAEALWTADELVVATGGQLTKPVTRTVQAVSIDSRSIAEGDLFVAIKGDKMDGHDFAAKALQSGAGVAMVSRTTPEMESAGPLLVVADDPLRGLENLGRAARARSNAQIIAVTGSVGKTSTKEMLRVALSASGETHASAASFNNHWGVPLTLARFPRSAAFGVFEIGMNHSGEITPLVGMVRPHVAIVTTVAASHLGHFKSLDEIAKAKAEIFSGVVPGGAAVINRDIPHFEMLAAAAQAAGVSRIYGFGKHADADIRLDRVALHPTCCCITASVFGEQVIYKLGLPGEHMAINSLAVLAAAKLAGADLARAALALSEAKPAKGRGVQQSLQMPGGELLLIDESYNANPASVRAALALLATAKPGKGGRRIAVLGDMLELGESGPALHAGLSEALDSARVDVLYAAGPLMAHLWKSTPDNRRGAHADVSEHLKDTLLAGLKAGDVVMVKGSLGSRMGPLVEAMKAQWPTSKET
ncbi:MAG: UDP-N-acetylmuramoylalanyl-D-glutamyl-2,6-diaminopimelate--D-alanyl-D-alanine ligase [Phyllobacteriaceae bacterium]|nr:UDP-N-acetylmuramoylalanyl-D-glutamyl-2,6-diaminopimelate--D-alanyl-D-alanine ligase [Phyllobacteriaceae bacterium]